MRPTVIFVLIAALLSNSAFAAGASEETGVLQSSVIKAASYDPATQTLIVTFPGGSMYAYSGVPADVYAALRSAASAGVYFRAHIKTVYLTRRLQPPNAPLYGCDRARDTRTSRMASTGVRNSQPCATR